MSAVSSLLFQSSPAEAGVAIGCERPDGPFADTSDLKDSLPVLGSFWFQSSPAEAGVAMTVFAALAQACVRFQSSLAEAGTMQNLQKVKTFQSSPA